MNKTKEMWASLEEIPDYYPMMTWAGWHAYKANVILKSLGFRNKFSKLMLKFNNNICALYVVKKDYNNLVDEFIKKVSLNPDWGLNYIDDLKKREKKLFDGTSDLRKINLKKLSNKDLYKVYDKYYSLYIDLHLLHWPQTISDFIDNKFSKYLMNYLKSRKKDNKSIGSIFSTLTTPLEDSHSGAEYKALLKILDYINENNKAKKAFTNLETKDLDIRLPEIDIKLNKKINKHVYNFSYLGYGVSGPSWGRLYFLDILASLARQKIDAKKQLLKIKKEKIELELKQQKIIDDLNIDEKFQQIFKFAQRLVFSKGTRKDTMFYNFFAMERLYAEIGRRFYLTVKQVRYLYPNEIKGVLLENKLDMHEINDRYDYSLHYSYGNKDKELILTGKEAKEFISKLNFIKEKTSNISYLIGDCASPGKVKGETVVVNTVEDMQKMKDGAILVSIATTPNLVPAIKKAKAIITDAGGIACHAAIVSRELNIPCVVGTKIATKVLKDGTLVDVNASHGKVNIIKKD